MPPVRNQASHPKPCRLSVVIPIFNEEAAIDPLINRIGQALKSLEGHSEMIFVNDGSSDGTAVRLGDARRADPRIKIINLSRNFGQQFAITAGLDYAEGDACIIIDGDLQDPPELIPELIHHWEKGYEIVHAVRRERQGETVGKKLTAKVFYRLLRLVTRVPIVVDSGDFRLLDRKVVLSLRAFRERSRFIRGLVHWTGYRQTSVYFVRDARVSGYTKFSWAKMTRLALDAITSFSALPLQAATLLGFLFSLGAFAYGVYIFYCHYFTGRTINGWTSLMAAILFFGGVQLIFLGILGGYVGRIFDEVKERPLYLVRSLEGFDEEQ